MCMLIHHPATATPFTRAEFADFNRRNGNGFGAMWRTPTGEVHHRKGMLDLGQQWQLYRSLLENGCRELTLHWRFATSGPRDYHNCHPMTLAGDTLLMHNGVLRHRSTRDLSDTWCFALDVLEPALRRDSRAPYDRRFAARLAVRIGASNKLVLWHREEPEPVVIGRQHGVTYRGRWYSNTYAWTVPDELRPPSQQFYLSSPSPVSRRRAADHRGFWESFYGD